MTASNVLPILHEQLAWPAPSDIFNPSGAGPSVYARLAGQKLAEPIRHLDAGRDVRAGVLMGDPASDSSDDPLGVVCEFAAPISEKVLREVHKLAWSFGRSKLLVTVEPHLLRIWSCYEKPNFEDEKFSIAPVQELRLGTSSSLTGAANLLHWAEIASGQLVTRNATRFNRDERANARLLANLRFIRRKLKETLREPVVHDLLARLIFIQFLFQRKGRRGKPALHRGVLYNLYQQGILSDTYTDLSDILLNKQDTYRFFQWLDQKFNGDLFPEDWREEQEQVLPAHLKMLAEFVSGDMIVDNGQRCLWPLYSFDAIPLEFISSIYEEFVIRGDDNATGVGEHYTPTELVDFVLDRVLPWRGRRYDLKILDPACGSGIFLVKAFQRLVYRWRESHPGDEPSAAFLRSLLENNIFGVDINERAVRVASFSLYLAMCDEKDPRHYWTTIKFPDLRNVTLRVDDFFAETSNGLHTNKDAAGFDIVVGNAPWGDSSLTPEARQWAKLHDWKAADEQGGALFLPKAAMLTRRRGRICMIQSANSLLFNIGGNANAFRGKLFDSFKVHEVVNLSMRRFDTFVDAIAPTCIISMSPGKPDGEPIAYWSPRTTPSNDLHDRIVLEAADLNWVYPLEARRDPRVWSALALGSRRDLELVRRLRADSRSLSEAIEERDWQLDRGFQRGVKVPYIDQFCKENVVIKRIRRKDATEKALELLRGALAERPPAERVLVVCYKEHAEALIKLPEAEANRVAKVVHFGDKSKESQGSIGGADAMIVLGPLGLYPDRLQMRIVEDHRQWDGCPTVATVSDFPKNINPVFEHPRELSSYTLPVVLMKESWTIDPFRFRCIVVCNESSGDSLLYSQSFYGIHAPTEHELASFAAVVNSSLLVYYLYMTGGRLAAYRPTARKTEIADVPLPPHPTLSLSELARMREAEIDNHTLAMYQLSIVERALVEDFFEYTLPDFKLGTDSAGRKPVRYGSIDCQDGDLRNYCDFFLRVLRAGFGKGKTPCATVYRFPVESHDGPFCLIGFHLDYPNRNWYTEEFVDPGVLLEKLVDIDRVSRSEKRFGSSRGQRRGSVFYQRVARIYTSTPVADLTGEVHLVPTVFVVKPNQRRYWTRAAALRDADDVAADIITWTETATE